MGADKKKIRQEFRDAVFGRDKYKCVMCGKPDLVHSSFIKDHLDAHHITDRSLMPHGGYVKENGISLCAECHVKAEQFHSTGQAYPGYAPDDLYRKINSSYETAVKASEKLGS